MQSYDFAVDLEALVKAAQATAEAVTSVKDHDISDFVPGEAALGSAVVWSAVDEFQERWERGVNDMVRDIEECSGRIGKVALTYAEFDQGGYESLSALGNGTTPRLRPWGGG